MLEGYFSKSVALDTNIKRAFEVYHIQLFIFNNQSLVNFPAKPASHRPANRSKE